MSKRNIRTLRWVALSGLAVVLLVDFGASVRMRSGWSLGVVMFIAFPLAVALTSLVLMPKAGGKLLRNKDLLVPLALVTIANKLLDWLAAVPILGWLLKPSLPLHVLSLSFSLSLHWLLSIALAVAYASWVTGAVLELVRAGQGDPCLVVPMAMRRFWRMLGVMFVGLAVLTVVSSCFLLLLPVIGFVALLPLAGFAIIWNFATAALLPVTWQSEGGFWTAFRAGVVASLANLRKWGLLLLAQMVLLGLVFFHYSSSVGHTSVNWSVNAFWIGGYEANCRWYGWLAKVRHTSKLPLVETLLTFLLGGLAVAIKIAIVQRLQPEPPSVTMSAGTANTNMAESAPRP